MIFGRAFEAGGEIVLPCEYCGNPIWEPAKHTCAGLLEAGLARMKEANDEDRD